MSIKYVFLLFLVLLTLAYQNCTQSGSVRFASITTLKSEIDGGGGGYNGKPDHGYYCRAFDNMPCPAQVPNQQGLIKVDASGIHLIQDTCSSTAVNFQFDDAAVDFSPLAKNYLGVSRGIFKKCEVDSSNLPLPPVQMTDAFCFSHENKVAVAVSKDLVSGVTNFNLYFLENSSLRTARGDSVLKLSSANSVDYLSLSSNFDLKVYNSISQTARGRLQVSVDDRQINTEVNCRSASPEPTVIVNRDLEVSATWTDISQLVGYWKLNEVNALNGAQVFDSSSFGLIGSLTTDNAGVSKSDTSVAGGALFFDGTGDFVRVLGQDASPYDFGMSSFSYMVWIKITGRDGSYDIPIWHGGSSPVYSGFDMECRFRCIAGVSDGLTQPNSLVTAEFVPDMGALVGRWVLLTAVVDRQGGRLRTYLDGVPVDSVNISALGSVSNNLDFFIGGSQGGAEFQGSIDDLMIWNKALSQNEIREIFQRLRPKFY